MHFRIFQGLLRFKAVYGQALYNFLSCHPREDSFMDYLEIHQYRTEILLERLEPDSLGYVSKTRELSWIRKVRKGC